MISISFFKRESKHIHDILLSTKSFDKIDKDDQVVTFQRGKPWEKVAQILVTLTSCCDLDFKC